MTKVAIIRQRGREVIDETLLEWDVGEIKWFDPVRRFGFILLDDGSEVFFPWLSLLRSGIPERQALPGVRVRFKVAPPDRPNGRPRAERIEIERKR